MRSRWWCRPGLPRSTRCSRGTGHAKTVRPAMHLVPVAGCLGTECDLGGVRFGTHHTWLPRCTSDPIQTAVSSLSLRSCKRSTQHAARSTHPARPDNSLAAHCGCAWDECRASARVQVKLGGLEQERHGRGQHQASPAQRTSDFFTGSYAVDPRKEKRGEARPLDARFADPHE
jgi:hypothetical protein